MPSTHLCLDYHVVFSTKNREPWIGPAWRDELHGYVGGCVRELNGVPLVELLRESKIEFDERYLW